MWLFRACMSAGRKPRLASWRTRVGVTPSIAAVSFAEDLGGLRVADAIDRTLRRTPQHRTPHSAHRSRIAAYGAGQSRRWVSRRDIVTSSVHILVIPSLTRR